MSREVGRRVGLFDYLELDYLAHGERVPPASEWLVLVVGGSASAVSYACWLAAWFPGAVRVLAGRLAPADRDRLRSAGAEWVTGVRVLALGRRWVAYEGAAGRAESECELVVLGADLEQAPGLLLAGGDFDWLAPLLEDNLARQADGRVVGQGYRREWFGPLDELSVADLYLYLGPWSVDKSRRPGVPAPAGLEWLLGLLVRRLASEGLLLLGEHAWPDPRLAAADQADRALANARAVTAHLADWADVQLRLRPSGHRLPGEAAVASKQSSCSQILERRPRRFGA